MGIALWLLCGVAVFAVSRMIVPARPAGFGTELLLVTIASALSGLAATALDFGGWGELEWRAAVFVILCDFAVIGISRAIRMTLMRRATGH